MAGFEVSRNARFYVVWLDPHDVLLVEPMDEEWTDTVDDMATAASLRPDAIYFYVDPPSPRYLVSASGGKAATRKWEIIDTASDDTVVAQLHGTEGERLICKVADALNNGWKKSDA